MKEFKYDVDNWIHAAPQGYWTGWKYGHSPDLEENPNLFDDDDLRIQIMTILAQFVTGERAAFAASSGLINAVPDIGSKNFLATQTLDEARHVEVFRRRFLDLNIPEDKVEDTIAELANPNLIKFGESLMEIVDKKDYVAGIMGQNIILEGLAFTTFDFIQMMWTFMDSVGAAVLAGVKKDEQRHVGFGINRLGSIQDQLPEKKGQLQRFAKEMAYYVVTTYRELFADLLPVVERNLAKRADAIKDVQIMGFKLDKSGLEGINESIIGKILEEYKIRMERLGLEYEDPR